MNRWHWVVAIGLALTLAGARPTPVVAGETRSLAGEWRVQLDPGNVGLVERWFDHSRPGRIVLPGSIDQAQLAPANSAPPSLDGLYRRFPFEGPAWYQYTLMIPGSWQGKRVSVAFERVHWETRVWVDGQEIPGTQDSLVAPHVHDLGDLGTPGTRCLTVRVDNTRKLDLGGFVSALYEGTQTNWNGLVGAIELRAVDPLAIDHVKIEPDVARKLARVRLTLSNSSGKPARGRLELDVRTRPGAPPVASDASDVTVEGAQTEVVRELPLGDDAKLWDEFHPNVYRLHATLSADAGGRTSRDEWAGRFGLREVSTRDSQITLNGQPILLRGTLECGIFPRTGYPPTDVNAWRRIMKTIKAHGLNFLRFHSWCPPDAAFEAADTEGLYLQVEAPQANVEVGRDPARDQFVEAELLRIVHTYGNHPSFVLMTLGNEFGGDDAVLSRWIDSLRRDDSRRLYSSASAGQTTANRQFTEGGPRGVRGPGTSHDFRDDLAHEDRPVLGHEIGQWAVFPNLLEMPKYDGVLAPRNFELVRDDLAKKGLLDLAPRFLEATGRQSALLYKEEIEVLLRTPNSAGFSLLDLHDYPGQGMATVGMLDPFWDSKGFVTPDQHARYAGPVVPLVRLPKRTYTTAETLQATAELSHFGPADLPDARPEWTLVDSAGQTIARGAFEPRTIERGSKASLGAIQADLSRAPAPCRLTLSLSIADTPYANDWSIWVYPEPNPARPLRKLVVTRDWDEPTLAALAAGRAVLFLPRAFNPETTLRGRFLPVFWSPVWFPDQKPNTMGILCDPGHPALAQFPTDGHSDWQWFELLDHSQSLILDTAPAELTPIVRVVDNFARNHRLANVVEARVGPGRLLLCTIDLPGLAAEHPTARQLLESLEAYAQSDAFQPTTTVEESLVESWLAPPK